MPAMPARRQLLDALRLAFGTLTVLPVSPPTTVDRTVAGWAMALGPLAGTALGLAAASAAWVLSALWSPLLVAVAVVGLLAAATRLIHWDGLADTADGLGSGREAGVALEIMRRSDIGPFGVFAVVLVFAVQAAAVATLLTPDAVFVAFLGPTPPPADTAGVGRDLAAVVAAVVLGRLALALACRSGQPAARSRGLGSAVAGSVGAVQLAVAAALAAVVVVLAVVLGGALGWLSAVLAAVASAGWALGATELLRRRVGGVTGDTLGALVETTTAVALVVLAAGL